MTESFYHSARDCSFSYCEQVMSPSTEGNDNDAAQQPPATGHERTSSEPAAVVIPPAHARSAESEALAKALEMLSGMDARMQKMEASQARIVEDERMRSADDSGRFISMLGADFAGRLHGGALKLSDLREIQGSKQKQAAMGRIDGLRIGPRRPTQHRVEPLPQPPV